MKKKPILSLFACCCAATACDMDLTVGNFYCDGMNRPSVLDVRIQNLFHAELRFIFAKHV